MSETTSYPLSWPAGWKRTEEPKRSRFGTHNSKPSVDKATNKLLHEISLLNNNNGCILSTNVPLRSDNRPYSSSVEPKDRGVAVYFEYNDQDMVIACDSFDKVGCNIYAIALTIEAMRGIDRWGCSELMQRAFTGFKALPEKASASSWFQILELPETATTEEIKARFKELSKKYHPDIPGGDAEKFIQIKMAYEDALNNKQGLKQ